MSEISTNGTTEIGIAKPFPWRCLRCRRTSVWRVTIPYHCQRMQESQSVDLEIEEFSVPRCAECGELVFDYDAEAQINSALQ